MSAAIVIHELVLFSMDQGSGEIDIKYGMDEVGDNFNAWIHSEEKFCQISGYDVYRLCVCCDSVRPIVYAYVGPVDKQWNGPSVKWTLGTIEKEFDKRGYTPSDEWLEMMEDLRCPVDEDTF